MKVIDCFILLIIAISSCTDRISDDTRSKMHGVWANSGYTCSLHKLHNCVDVTKNFGDSLDELIVDLYWNSKKKSDSSVFLIVERNIVDGLVKYDSIRMYNEGEKMVRSKQCKDGTCRILFMSPTTKNAMTYCILKSNGEIIKERRMEYLYGRNKPFDHYEAGCGADYNRRDVDNMIKKGFDISNIVYYDISEYRNEFFLKNIFHNIKQLNIFETEKNNKEKLIDSVPLSDKKHLMRFDFSENYDSIFCQKALKRLHVHNDGFYFRMEWTKDRILLTSGYNKNFFMKGIR